MHAETLRGVSRAKLPFAEYSVVARAQAFQASVRLFDIVWDEQPTRLRRFGAPRLYEARRAVSRQVSEGGTPGSSVCRWS